MKTVTEMVKQFYRFHTKPATKLTHYVGIPLIIFALLIFLGWFHFSVPGIFDMHLAWIASIALVAYYFFLDWQLAIGTLLALIILNFIAGFISQPTPSVATFVFFLVCLAAGAIAVFVGHYLEGNKPSVKDYAYSLVSSPMVLIAEVFFALGQKQDLQKAAQKPGK